MNDNSLEKKASTGLIVGPLNIEPMIKSARASDGFQNQSIISQVKTGNNYKKKFSQKEERGGVFLRMKY